MWQYWLYELMIWHLTLLEKASIDGKADCLMWSGREFQQVPTLKLRSCFSMLVLMIWIYILHDCLLKWGKRGSMEGSFWEWYVGKFSKIFRQFSLQQLSLKISCNFNTLYFLDKGSVCELYFVLAIVRRHFFWRMKRRFSSNLLASPQATIP